MKKKIFISALSAVSTIFVLTVVLCTSIVAYLYAPRKVKRYFYFNLNSISEVRVIVPYHVESEEFPGCYVKKEREYVLEDSSELLEQLSNEVLSPRVFKMKCVYDEVCEVLFKYNNKEYSISTLGIKKESKYGMRLISCKYNNEIYDLVMSYLNEKRLTNEDINEVEQVK